MSVQTVSQVRSPKLTVGFSQSSDILMTYRVVGAGRGTAACMAPITAETVQVQLETARALAVAVARRREHGGNRSRRPPAQEGVRATATGALDFSLGGVSIAPVGGIEPVGGPTATSAGEMLVHQGSSEAPSAAELRRKRAALAALERQRAALQAQHNAAVADESHLAGELEGLLASQPMLGATGVSPPGATSSILGSASPVDAALAAEAQRRNRQGERSGGLGHLSRASQGRPRRPASVGNADPTDGRVGLTVGSGALLRHGPSTEADTAPDLVVGTVRSRTAPIPSTGGAGSADMPDGTAVRERGGRGRRRESASFGRRRPTDRGAQQRQPMDPPATRSRAEVPAAECEHESPAVGWQHMFIGAAAPASQSADGQSSATEADLAPTGPCSNDPSVSRRRGGRLLPRGPLRAARAGQVAGATSPSPVGSAGVGPGVGQAATAATLAQAQDAAQRREAAAIAEAERRREAAAAEARASRVVRDQRRRAALARAAENRAAEAQREESREEAKRQAQERIAARATAHREEQLAAEAARRSAREAALEARISQAAW